MSTLDRPGLGLARVLVAVAAVLGSAALFYLGTGLAPVAALTWVAPLPVLLLAPRASAPTAAVTALAGYFLGTAGSWDFFLHSHDEPLPMGLAISAGCAVLFALAALLFRGLLLRGRPVPAVLCGPAVWCGALFLIARVSPVGVVGTLATTQTGTPVLLQTAAVTGFLGVEFLVLFAPCVIAALAAPRPVRPAARVRTAVLGLLLAGIVLGGGEWRLATQHPGGSPVRVALVSTTNPAWAPDLATPAGRALLAGYAQRIASVPAGTRLVVLPEGTFTANGGNLTTLVHTLSPIAARQRLTIVVGVIQQAGGGPHKVVTSNIALAVPPDGVPVSYLKQHDQVAAHGHQLVFPPLDGTRLGVEVCADVDFTDPSRGYAGAGARLLAVPASDEGADGWQHGRTALLRGVENGVGVAWSDRDGDLLVSDGFGRVLGEARSGGAGAFTTLDATVPAAPGATPYTRFGDWFGVACLVIALLGLAGLAIRARERAADVVGARTGTISAAELDPGPRVRFGPLRAG